MKSIYCLFLLATVLSSTVFGAETIVINMYGDVYNCTKDGGVPGNTCTCLAVPTPTFPIGGEVGPIQLKWEAYSKGVRAADGICGHYACATEEEALAACKQQIITTPQCY